MLWPPTARALVVQLAVRVLPAPLTADVAQPEIEIPPSWKLTLPVGAVPVTVAVNVTLAPDVDGLSELVSPVVVGGKPGPLLPHASISTMRALTYSVPVTLIRI